MALQLLALLAWLINMKREVKDRDTVLYSEDGQVIGYKEEQISQTDTQQRYHIELETVRCQGTMRYTIAQERDQHNRTDCAGIY